VNPLKNKILFFTLLAFSHTTSFTQNDSIKPNSIFIELGGVSGHFSINYDRTLSFNSNYGLIAGIGFSPSLIDLRFSPRLPIQFKLFYQLNRHSLDIGTAFTPYFWYDSNSNISNNLKDFDLAIAAQIGYKYSIWQRFYLGIAFTPIIFDSGDFQFYPWGALRFGVKF